MLLSSETNPAESSETKDAEGIQLQNNPASKKQKSSEEEAADTNKNSDQHHLKETRNKKNNINKIKGGAGATTPESPQRPLFRWIPPGSFLTTEASVHY